MAKTHRNFQERARSIASKPHIIHNLTVCPLKPKLILFQLINLNYQVCVLLKSKVLLVYISFSKSF